MTSEQFQEAIKKYASQKQPTIDETSELIQIDGIAKEDADKIAAGIFGQLMNVGSNAKPLQPAAPPIEIKKFDFKNLTGDNWTAYLAFIDTLPWGRHFKFSLYAAVPIMKERYPGLKDTPIDMVGLTIKNDVPVNTSSIPIRIAKEYNAQILNEHSRAGNGRYYLLADSKA
ncbi:MAG: hypothetical protein Q8941_20480 [Bacteroidota bacterium]|nr:hypothetical protein [Bacteroidota bacterium]